MKDLTEILKNCPSGMEVDCSMYDNVYFDKVLPENYDFPIQMYTMNEQKYKNIFCLTREGKYNNMDTSKCVIFPKGKKTWDEFQIPFKDGDVLTYMFYGKPTTYIYYAKGGFNTSYYVGWSEENKKLYINYIKDTSALYGNRKELRLATKEEADKMFEELKQEGYIWNIETKTLDKLPKFKVGDKVRHKNNHNVVFTITSIEEDSYVCGAKMAFWFDDQDQYELVPNKFNINTLVPFESRVLVRYNKEAKWCPAIWGFYDYEKGLPHRYAIVGGITFAYCIPYEGNEHLLGKTEDCKNFYKTWE